MITDFRNYTNSGLRNITFNGKNSLTDFGILIAAGTATENLTVRSVQDTVPFRQGVIDSSWLNGELFYEPRQLVYRFKILAETFSKLSEKAADIKAWLTSDGTLEIYDSVYGSDWKFTECVLKDIAYEDGEKTSVPYMYLTATFECYPKMLKKGTSRIKLYDIMGYSPRIVVIENRIIATPYLISYDGIKQETTVTTTFYSETSGTQTFYVCGDVFDAKVESVTIMRDGESVEGLVTMTAPYKGTYGALKSNDELVIRYSKPVDVRAIVKQTINSRSFSIPSPSYRVKVYNNSGASMDINGKSQDITKNFTLPAAALIELSSMGYGYYELWHDNTEERL